MFQGVVLSLGDCFAGGVCEYVGMWVLPWGFYHGGEGFSNGSHGSLGTVPVHNSQDIASA